MANENQSVSFDYLEGFTTVMEPELPEDRYTQQVINEPLTITLYNNRSEAHRIDKTNYLFNALQVKGSFKNEVDLLSPVIELSRNIASGIWDFNYVKIQWSQGLVKYYFVDRIVYTTTNIAVIYCSIDVLYTYKESILNCVAFIERNEFEFNNKIADDKRVVTLGQNITTGIISNNILLDNALNTVSPALYNNGVYVLSGYGIGVKEV